MAITPGVASGDAWQELTDTTFTPIFTAPTHGDKLSTVHVFVYGGIIAVRVTPLHSAQVSGGSATSFCLGDDGSGSPVADDYPFACKRENVGEIVQVEVKKISGDPKIKWTALRQ